MTLMDGVLSVSKWHVYKISGGLEVNQPTDAVTR